MITPNSAAQAYRLDGEDKKLHFAKLRRGTLLKEKINGQLCLRKQDATITFFLNVTLQWPKIFSQISVIPIGSDPTAFFANLFLNYYENRQIKDF